MFKPDKVKRVFIFPEEQGYLVISKDIKVTSQHRFRIKDKWVEAGSLKLGDKPMKEETSATPTRCTDIHLVGVETITSIEYVQALVTVYNLEVNPYHTFIADGVVVHNASLNKLAAPGPIAK